MLPLSLPCMFRYTPIAGVKVTASSNARKLPKELSRSVSVIVGEAARVVLQGAVVFRYDHDLAQCECNALAQTGRRRDGLLPPGIEPQRA